MSLFETANLSILMEDRRDNMEVSIEWDRPMNWLFLRVIDFCANQHYIERIPNDKAIDAFNHPFMYLLNQLD